MRRAVWPLIVSVVIVGLLFLTVFPARSYLTQRRQLATASTRLHRLTERNAQLSTEVQKLNTDAEIERLAREDYNLVKPGEEAYAILPAPAGSVPKTQVGPGNPPAGSGTGDQDPVAEATANAPDADPASGTLDPPAVAAPAHHAGWFQHMVDAISFWH